MADWKLRSGVDCSTALIVKVGGIERFLPVLVWKQNKVVVPLMLKALPVIEAAGARKDPETGKLIMPPPEAAMRLFSADILDTMGQAVYVALTRAYDLTPEEFAEAELTVHEVTAAMPAVVQQTQFFGPAQEGEKVSGEARAVG